jgi:hypothetical protein
VAAPSRKVAVPVGVPAPGAAADTVAVNVTDWPNTDGLTEVVTVVELESVVTVCVIAGEVLALKLASPLYETVIVRFPTDSVEIVKVALPEKPEEPNVVAPSRNVAVPLGVPAPGLTAVIVAVKVTVWPNTDGLILLVTVVEVAALLTVCVIAAEVLGLKLPSPL